MGIPSDGSYGVPEGLISSFPCVCKDGKYEIVQGLDIDAYSRGKIDATVGELAEERDAVRDLGRLEPAAIEQVRSDAWPLVRDADELHDVLLNLVILSAEQAEPWRPWFDLLRKAGRAALAIAADDKAIAPVPPLPLLLPKATRSSRRRWPR